MKCYSVKKEEIVNGIPDIVPHAPGVKSKKGLITDAHFVLESINLKDKDEVKRMLIDDLTSASEMAFFELTPNIVKKRYKFFLVAYNPEEYRLDKENGDESHILYRSMDLFIARSPVNGCRMLPINEDRHYITTVKNKPVCKKLTPQMEYNRERERIEKRRETYTTVYEFD